MTTDDKGLNVDRLIDQDSQFAEHLERNDSSIDESVFGHRKCRKFSSNRQEVDGSLNRVWTVCLCLRQILVPVLFPRLSDCRNRN